MEPVLSDFSDQALAQATLENLCNMFWDLRGRWPQAVFEETGSLRRWASPIPMGFVFNAVVSLRPPVGDEAEVLRQTFQFFQQHGSQGFDWWFMPGSQPSGWARLLEGRGLMFSDDPPGMAMELAKLPEQVALPEGTVFKTVESPQEMDVFARTFQPGYGLPASWLPFVQGMMQASLGTHMTSYVGYVGQKPAAVASVYLNAGVAGVYNVATLKEWRGRGLGAGITLHGLLQARRQGYRAGILHSSNSGYRVYQRLGFRQVCKMDHYYWGE